MTAESYIKNCLRRDFENSEEIERHFYTRFDGLLTDSDPTDHQTDVNGKTIWVHSSSTADLTYQTFNKKRGQPGMEDNGVLPEFKGTAVHDCWSPYWKYTNVRHAVCNAHLLRELTEAEQYSPEHKWAPEFKALLRSMKKARDKAAAKGKMQLSYYYLHKFDREYDRIMKLADEECPVPPDQHPNKKGRKKKGKERALIERLIKLKASVCLFTRDFRVPFDNNQAERDVRNVKTKTKVAGCFRTEEGHRIILMLCHISALAESMALVPLQL